MQTSATTRTITADASAERLWRPDLLPGFESCHITLAGPRLTHESELVATLVRRASDRASGAEPSGHAVLSLPGLNDAFFQPDLAAFFEGLGLTFYALDPRRSGRSLRHADFRDYVSDLDEFFEELDAAYAELAAHHESVTLVAHSTGGLVAALWAAKRPGKLAALVLNSPWLGLWGTSAYAPAVHGAIGALARRRPTARLPLPDPGNRYLRCARVDVHEGVGEHPAFRATGAIPVRAGWLSAILHGQRQVARGLDIDAPVLVACSTRSYVRAARFSERARRSDIVLDVNQIARRASKLGRRVTLVRIPDGFHDLTLSVPQARERYFAEVGRWLPAVLAQTKRVDATEPPAT